jgi:hypothetical protein
MRLLNDSNLTHLIAPVGTRDMIIEGKTLTFLKVTYYRSFENTEREYSFTWNVPFVTETFIVEVGLVPEQLIAYDTAWLKVT